MRHVERFWHLLVFGFFLFVVISFARHVMATTTPSGTAYSWSGVGLWILIISSLWLVVLSLIAHRKNKQVQFMRFSLDEIEIKPRAAAANLVSVCWMSMLGFSLVVCVLGIALFDKFAPFELLKWVSEQAKWILTKVGF